MFAVVVKFEKSYMFWSALPRSLKMLKVIEFSVEVRAEFRLQWSLYFKTNHWTMKMWPYIADGPK